MDGSIWLTFLALVFGAVFTLLQLLVVPSYGTSPREMKRLQKRLGTLQDTASTGPEIFLLRPKYRQRASALERLFERMPGARVVAELTESSGQSLQAYQLVLISLALALVGGTIGWHVSGHPAVTGVAAAAAAWLPFMKLNMDRAKRFARFEEQLPEALDAMTRALLSGYPFTETLRLVADEMENPIAQEFGVTFDAVNAGMDIRVALRELLTRVPSITLMAVITTVILQRETGGNLAETLSNTSKLIRERFRFQRHVRTLTAEGRISAWVMALMPFALFAFFYLMMPDYVRPLAEEPTGHKMILTALGLLFAGVLWLRRLISIEV